MLIKAPSRAAFEGPLPHQSQWGVQYTNSGSIPVGANLWLARRFDLLAVFLTPATIFRRPSRVLYKNELEKTF